MHVADLVRKHTLVEAATRTWREALAETLVEAPRVHMTRMVVADAILKSSVVGMWGGGDENRCLK